MRGKNTRITKLRTLLERKRAVAFDFNQYEQVSGRLVFGTNYQGEKEFEEIDSRNIPTYKVNKSTGWYLIPNAEERIEVPIRFFRSDIYRIEVGNSTIELKTSLEELMHREKEYGVIEAPKPVIFRSISATPMNAGVLA